MLTVALFVFSIFLVTPSMAESTENEMLKLLPNEIHGWKAYGKAKIYDRETIYDYMDGAGEIYRTYGFKKLIVKQYTKSSGPEIIIEVFDMDSPEDAFGIFSHGQGRDIGNAGIGQDSEYKRGLLCFWKNKFFVCVRSGRETPQAKKAVLALGMVVSKAVKTEGEKPAILNYLPENEFSEKGLRYFHKYEILNYHYFVADKNILHLDEYSKSVLARYKDDKSYLLLVQYKNETQSRTAFESFMNAYMPDAKQTSIIQTENGKWTAVTVQKNFLIIVFDALEKAGASSKIEVVRKGLR
ncbi:MAG: hypothetical protein OEW69_10655 [Nitrospirota bacterium]|nr:hypothetical protein [Nitrospirota bacterium]